MFLHDIKYRGIIKIYFELIKRFAYYTDGEYFCIRFSQCSPVIYLSNNQFVIFQTISNIQNRLKRINSKMAIYSRII